ncbi:MAG: SRPBCC family protein [Planctomycetota bacterium]
MSHPLSIRALGELEIVMTRRFDAPRALVFDAWTRPELLKRWLGVRGGWTMPVCEIDLRVGGTYRYVWRHESGAEMGMGGVYREIVAGKRIVATERFDSPWYPGEALITNELEEIAGGTLCSVHMLYETKEARDMVLASPMESGIGEGYAALDKLFESMV